MWLPHYWINLCGRGEKKNEYYKFDYYNKSQRGLQLGVEQRQKGCDKDGDEEWEQHREMKDKRCRKHTVVEHRVTFKKVHERDSISNSL